MAVLPPRAEALLEGAVVEVTQEVCFTILQILSKISHSFHLPQGLEEVGLLQEREVLPRLLGLSIYRLRKSIRVSLTLD